ncbi:sugar O-acyltransferase [Vibrio pectenicida]|nr:sugar O-acyltransferase [Vibrio pectenicida]
MITNRIAIFGTSGFAQEVADICEILGYNEIVLLTHLDDCLPINGLNVIRESEIEEINNKGFHFAIGVGDGHTRKKIRELYPHLIYPNLIHPSATFGRNQKSKIESQVGNIITAGVRFTTNIKIGDFGIFNLNSTVGHDCVIGDFVSVMPSVNISGNVVVENLCMIGVGATILEGNTNKKITLGEESLIGANSLVRKDTVNQAIYFGIPAKKIR